SKRTTPSTATSSPCRASPIPVGAKQRRSRAWRSSTTSSLTNGERRTRGCVGGKSKAGGCRDQTGCSTCQSSPQEGIGMRLTLPTTKSGGIWHNLLHSNVVCAMCPSKCLPCYQNMAEDHPYKGVGECHPYREFEGMQPSRSMQTSLASATGVSPWVSTLRKTNAAGVAYAPSHCGRG